MRHARPRRGSVGHRHAGMDRISLCRVGTATNGRVSSAGRHATSFRATGIMRRALTLRVSPRPRHAGGTLTDFGSLNWVGTLIEHGSLRGDGTQWHAKFHGSLLRPARSRSSGLLMSTAPLRGVGSLYHSGMLLTSGLFSLRHALLLQVSSTLRHAKRRRVSTPARHAARLRFSRR
jgi:hypothetical protein